MYVPFDSVSVPLLLRRSSQRSRKFCDPFGEYLRCKLRENNSFKVVVVVKLSDSKEGFQTQEYMKITWALSLGCERGRG